MSIIKRVTVILILIGTIFNSSGAFAYGYSDVEYEILRQVNAEREKYGLGTLELSWELSNAAYIRALEITDKFSHTRPDGTAWNSISTLAKGENIAKGYRDVDRVMAAWLTSSGHRKNILRSSFKKIGICGIKYNGVMYWVQIFGN